MNLLRNADFRAGTYEPVGQMALVLPNEWLAGWLDNGSLYRVIDNSLAVERFVAYNAYGPRHRPNMAKCLKPEILTITAVAPYLDPPRIEIPDQAVTGFKLYGTLCWWLCQRVNVTSGRKYRLGMRAHAWARATEDPGDARYSHGVGIGPFHVVEGSGATDDQQNYRFRVGVDSDGDLDSIATAGAMWANGAHIYNEFWDVPALEFTAAGHLATIYLMVDNLWGFVNSNAYLSRPFLEEVTPPELAELTARVDAIEVRANALEMRVTALEAETPHPPPPEPPPPPPVVTYSPPRIKGGVHYVVDGSHDGYGQVARDCAAAGKPMFVLSCMDFGALAELTDAPGGHAYRVIRLRPQPGDEDTPPQNWQWPIANTRAMARDWMSKIYPQLDRNRRDIWDWCQTINEPMPADYNAMMHAIEFTMECMFDAEDHGVPLAIWAWSTGTPSSPRTGDTFDQMTLMAPTLDYAAKHGHCLCVHEGPVDPEHRLLQDGAGFLALRYRHIKATMDELALAMPPVIIGEAYQVDGHRRPDFNDWHWYLSELAKDDYVYGSAWYTLGNGDDYNFAGKPMLRFGEMLLSL